MKRYVPFLLIALILILAVLAGSSYLARVNKAAERQPLQEITVYTTLPAENASVLGAAYEKQKLVRIRFVPLDQTNLLEKLGSQVKDKEKDGAAMILADEATLAKASASGCLVPYLSQEGDQVPEEFRQGQGYWTGVWYDPVVFCFNQDYLKTLHEVPDNWNAISRMPEARIGVTDFLAADAASNLFCSMIAQFGDQAAYRIWADIHPKVVQYAHYLSNPVRQAGMGEVDIAIAVESEALRYMHGGYPLHIVYPADGTAAIVTGTGIVAGQDAKNVQLAQNFADWLLTDDAQLALQQQEMFFVPTNPGIMAYKAFAGKNLMLFSQRPDFTPEQRKQFLDTWLKEIRFK